MFNKIKKWCANRKQEKDKDDWKAGYNWAAGSLLRGEETPQTVNNYMLHTDLFDYGAFAATEKLIECKIIEDDHL